MTARQVNPSSSQPQTVIVTGNYKASSSDVNLDVQQAGATVTLPDNPTVGTTVLNVVAEVGYELSGGLNPLPVDPLSVAAFSRTTASYTAAGWVFTIVVSSANAPNYVYANNANPIAPANPMIFAAPAISRKGSGVFDIDCTSCPVPQGAPAVITYQILMDGNALPPVQKAPPTGPGDDSPCNLPAVVVVTDTGPHIFALSASIPGAETLADGAGHCTVKVFERNS
jgi:hypothetical protein